MKQIVAAFVVIALIGAQVSGADLTRGVTFTSTDTVTATKLHNLVDNAQINADFLTGKTAVSSVAGSDLLLLYSASGAGLRKISADNFILENTSFITSQSDKTAIVPGDYVLIWDSVGNVLSKASIGNIIANTNSINSLSNQATVLTTDLIQILSAGTNAKATVSNIMRAAWSIPFTNLTAYTAPANLDVLVVWDSVNNANKQITLRSLVTNSIDSGALTAGDYAWGYSTNSNTVVRITMANIQSYATNAPQIARTNQLPMNFMSAEYAVPDSNGGGITNIAHSLGGIPQQLRWVLVCKTSDAGYAVGDEVDAGQFQDDGGSQPAFGFGANATNVWISFTKASKINRKDGSNNYDAITEASWRAKAYATRFP